MTASATVDMQAIGRTAKDAARRLATISTDVKNAALLAMSDALTAHRDEILRANQHDMQGAHDAGVTGYILDRLLLTPERLDQYASQGGHPQHPNWYLNLRDNPDVELQVGGEKKRMRAATAEGEDRARLWAKMTELYSGYDEYQSFTERVIPVVVLRPAEAT